MNSFNRACVWGKLTVHSRLQTMTKNTFMFPLTGEAEYNFGSGGIILPDYPNLELRIQVNDGMISLHKPCTEFAIPKDEGSSIAHLLDEGETSDLQYLPVEYYINDFVLIVSCLQSPGMRLIDDAVYRKCSEKCMNSAKCRHKILDRFPTRWNWQDSSKRQESTRENDSLLIPLNKSDEQTQIVKDRNRDPFMSGVICYRCSNSRWPVPIDRFYLIKNKSPSADQQQQEQWKVCCPLCLVFMNKLNLEIRKLNLEWVLKFNNHCLGSIVDLKADYLELTTTDGVKNLTDGIESVCSSIGRFITAIAAKRKHIYENSYSKAQKLQEPCSSQSAALEDERQEFLKDFDAELSDHRRNVEQAKKCVMELSLPENGAKKDCLKIISCFENCCMVSQAMFLLIVLASSFVARNSPYGMAYDHESIAKACEIKLQAANKAFNFLFFWHSMEAGFFGLCLALSLSICVVITFVNQELLDKCSSNFEEVVDMNLHLNYSNSSNESVILVKENARPWSFDQKFYRNKCQFTQYSQLAAGVGAFILCWFFLILRPRKFMFLQKSRTISSHLIVPTIILCLIFIITLSVSVIKFHIEVNYWCPEDLSSNNGCVNPYEFFDHSAGNDIYSYLLVAQILSWLSIVCWLFNFVTLLIRVYHHFDFPTYSYLNKVPRRRKPANHNQQNHCANGPYDEESDKFSNKGS